MEPALAEETFEDRREREKREDQARKGKTEALIREVCKVSGFTPEMKNDDSWNYACVNAHKGDESLYFTSCGYPLKDRIAISGNFPRTDKGERIDPYEYNEERHEISVSIAKTPEQIARDIERRFLPRYRELLRRVKEKVAQSNEYAVACARNLERIKGGKLTEEEEKGYIMHLSGEIFGEIRVHGETVRIELHSVPIEAAQRIVRILEE